MNNILQHRYYEFSKYAFAQYLNKRTELSLIPETERALSVGLGSFPDLWQFLVTSHLQVTGTDRIFPYARPDGTITGFYCNGYTEKLEPDGFLLSFAYKYLGKYSRYLFVFENPDTALDVLLTYLRYHKKIPAIISLPDLSLKENLEYFDRRRTIVILEAPSDEKLALLRYYDFPYVLEVDIPPAFRKLPGYLLQIIRNAKKNTFKENPYICLSPTLTIKTEKYRWIEVLTNAELLNIGLSLVTTIEKKKTKRYYIKIRVPGKEIFAKIVGRRRLAEKLDVICRQYGIQLRCASSIRTKLAKILDMSPAGQKKLPLIEANPERIALKWLIIEKQGIRKRKEIITTRVTDHFRPVQKVPKVKITEKGLPYTLLFTALALSLYEALATEHTALAILHKNEQISAWLREFDIFSFQSPYNKFWPVQQSFASRLLSYEKPLIVFCNELQLQYLGQYKKIILPLLPKDFPYHQENYENWRKLLIFWLQQALALPKKGQRRERLQTALETLLGIMNCDPKIAPFLQKNILISRRAAFDKTVNRYTAAIIAQLLRKGRIQSDPVRKNKGKFALKISEINKVLAEEKIPPLAPEYEIGAILEIERTIMRDVLFFDLANFQRLAD